MWPRMPATADVKGRAVALGPVSGGAPAVCQFYSRPASDAAYRSDAPYRPAASPPFRVEPLPAKITVRQIQALMAPAGKEPPPEQSPPGQQPVGGTPGPGRSRLAVRQRDVVLGVAGEEPAAASFRLPGKGVIAILGSPGSGKSNTLHALAALNPGQAWGICPVPPEDAGDFWMDLLVQAEGGGVPRETVLLVDDVDFLAPPALRALDQLNALGHSLAVTAAYSPMLVQRVPLVMTARAGGVGMLLGPRSMADGDLFGVRFEVETDAPPGRGVLISGGRSCALQVAWAGVPG